MRGNGRVVTFVSRAEQLRLRGQRNYDRYMLFTKGFVERDSPERVQWQRESVEDSLRDAEWNRRHGPGAGGAKVLVFAVERFDGEPAAPCGKCSTRGAEGV